MNIENNKPLVSVLVAARNEEHNIIDLLNSIERLSYPKDCLQILIGNDNSTDKTESIIRNFITEKPHYQLVNITSNSPSPSGEGKGGVLKGKANVLAQLAHHAKGDYYFYTDADIELPPDWVQTMLKYFEGNSVGVVTGVTIVKGNTWFEACQALEWLSALYIIKRLADYKIPATGMGNNMAVSAEAYWAVGGYEKIGFSIVEDYAIFKAIIDKGFEFRQIFEPSIMAFTKPPKNYFEQRKRWVTGGIESRSIMIIPALIQAFALPILLIISILDWKTTLGIFGFNLALNFVGCLKILPKMRLVRLFKYIPIYTVYMYVFWFLQFVNYLLPTKIVWKERQY
ncbi:MAG: glycosyltransferase [Spirosomaceae bacterium]|jgi:cellulose synthase/poly-beta-1,6-N-acetylglucosamine synthase-like glycosyltransferase|nr:glycosyltransferase [Spirosomataceae bacterium]